MIQEHYFDIYSRLYLFFLVIVLFFLSNVQTLLINLTIRFINNVCTLPTINNVKIYHSYESSRQLDDGGKVALIVYCYLS